MSEHLRSGKVRIGTRGSPLALAQTAMVCEALAKHRGISSSDIEVRVYRTTGDRILNQPLSEVGGKGLFTKELEVALTAGEIDFAVHSAKDMPTALPQGLVITAYLEREDVRDALASRDALTLEQLPRGRVIGTASLRREAQLRRRRPDLVVRPIRGNVHTRLRKVEDGEIDATLFGFAGLKRLGLENAAIQVLPIDDFLPAVGQGAIAIEARANDDVTRELLASINHRATEVALTVERAFLAELEGSCRTPIGGYATVCANHVQFRGMILLPDGSRMYEVENAGTAADAVELGIDAGAELKFMVSAGSFAKAV